MKRFVLADCNNFYVSCERVFNPKLLGKPVVVLSSNDACVISRSNEAKKIGIKMGQPAWECRELFKRHNVVVCSANFPLYGDMSARVMQTLSEYATDIEIYSVDEAFLYFPNRALPFNSPEEETSYFGYYAQLVRQQVRQKTGIPISIGLGSTKTLAKIANDKAKKDPSCNGVFDLTNHPKFTEILSTYEVGDVWGIGYRYRKFLSSRGITTAHKLAHCDERWVQKKLTINGLRTVRELRGVPCYKLQDMPEAKKSITVSRSFGINVTDAKELKEALAFHMTTAAEKLRKQKTVAASINVFVCFTNHHSPDRFYDSMHLSLPVPTAYTPDLITAAQICLQRMYKKGVIYKKIGVIIDDFYAANCVQMDSFVPMPDTGKHMRLMGMVDKINAKMGRNKIFFAAAGTEQNWHAKRVQKSPSYTTNWHELLTIKI